ncbi:MAG: SH3 domain-containing protein, partial [Geminicoccaceae bacterium]
MIRFGSSVMVVLMVCITLGEVDKASAQDSGWLQSGQTGKIEKSELEQTYMVDARALNFRNGASVGDAVIGSLIRETFLKKLDETINSVERRTWYRVVRQDGQEGWVASEYLAPVG